MIWYVLVPCVSFPPGFPQTEALSSLVLLRTLSRAPASGRASGSLWSWPSRTDKPRPGAWQSRCWRPALCVWQSQFHPPSGDGKNRTHVLRFLATFGDGVEFGPSLSFNTCSSTKHCENYRKERNRFERTGLGRCVAYNCPFSNDCCSSFNDDDTLQETMEHHRKPENVNLPKPVPAIFFHPAR